MPRDKRVAVEAVAKLLETRNSRISWRLDWPRASRAQLVTVLTKNHVKRIATGACRSKDEDRIDDGRRRIDARPLQQGPAAARLEIARSRTTPRARIVVAGTHLVATRLNMTSDKR